MQRYRVLQTYVPPLIADWILEQSNTRDTSVSVVIRDHLVTAWNRDNDHADRGNVARKRSREAIPTCQVADHQSRPIVPA